MHYKRKDIPGMIRELKKAKRFITKDDYFLCDALRKLPDSRSNRQVLALIRRILTPSQVLTTRVPVPKEYPAWAYVPPTFEAKVRRMWVDKLVSDLESYQ